MPKKFLQSFNRKAEQQPFLGLVVYAVLNFLRPAIYIILTPFYLYYLSETEYGLQDILVIIGAFFMILSTLRLSSAMLTVYYDYLDDRAKLKLYLSNIFSFSILIAGVVGTVFLFFGEWLFQSLFHSDLVQFYPYGLIVLVSALLFEINMVYFVYLRNEKDLLGYVVVVGAQILLTIIFQFSLVIFLDLSVLGLVIGNLLGNALVLMIILYREPNLITWKFDKKMISKSLRFSVALIPYLLIYWVLTRGGKFVLEKYADLSIVAVFALLLTLANIIIILVEAVVNAIRPFLFEIFADRTQSLQEGKVSLLTKMIVNVPLLIIPLIILVGSNIWLITSKTVYHVIEDYITVIALATFMLVYGKLFYQQLVFAQRSGVITALSFVVMVVLVGCFYTLVPTLQIWGVIYATLAANVLMAVLFYFAAQHYQPIKYSFRNIILIPLVFFLFLFGIEFICVEYLHLPRSTFGMVQFVIMTMIIVSLNYSSIGEYKKVFLTRSTADK